MQKWWLFSKCCVFVTYAVRLIIINRPPYSTQAATSKWTNLPGPPGPPDAISVNRRSRPWLQIGHKGRHKQGAFLWYSLTCFRIGFDRQLKKCPLSTTYHPTPKDTIKLEIAPFDVVIFWREKRQGVHNIYPPLFPEWEKVWSRLSAHLQQLFLALLRARILTIFDKKYCILTFPHKRESYLIVLQQHNV